VGFILTRLPLGCWEAVRGGNRAGEYRRSAVMPNRAALVSSVRGMLIGVQEIDCSLRSRRCYRFPSEQWWGAFGLGGVGHAEVAGGSSSSGWATL